MNILESIRETHDVRALMCAFLEIKNRLADDELGVANSLTDPVGQYAEYLSQKVYGGERTRNGTAGHDLVDGSGRKVEIKGRIKKHKDYKPKTYIKGSNVSEKNFDCLVYVVFDGEFEVEYAFEVRRKDFKKVFHRVEHNNSYPKWVIKAREEILEAPWVEDVTPLFRNVSVCEK